MNLLQLVLKQMRQRALSTWLTLLSVLLGVALAIAIMILRREAGALFGQNEYGYDVIVGPKGSPLQLVLNTVYQIDRSPGNVPYALFESLEQSDTYRGMVRIAVPYGVGDSYRDHRIVATTGRLFNVDNKGRPLTYVRFIKDAAGRAKDDAAGLPPVEAQQLIDSGAAAIDPEEYFQYRPGKRYELAHGRWFAADTFEAVVGSDVPRGTGLLLGDTFQAAHDLPQPGRPPDVHKAKWSIVGVMKPTHTASDRVIFIPLTSFYAVAEHDVGLVAQQAIRSGKDPNQAVAELRKHGHAHKDEPDEAHPPGHAEAAEEPEHYTLRPDGTIDLHLSKDVWGISAILIKARSSPMAMGLIYNLRNGTEADAVNPATVMRDFFANFLRGPSLVLLLIALLVTIVAGVGILVSIYNSVSARLREIAILRALGATRRRILTLICVEAGLIGLIGGLIGLIIGHLMGAAASVYADRFIGESINWTATDRYEWLYLLIVVVIAVLAGLVPALKAYRTPVATNLAAA